MYSNTSETHWFVTLLNLWQFFNMCSHVENSTIVMFSPKHRGMYVVHGNMWNMWKTFDLGEVLLSFIWQIGILENGEIINHGMIYNDNHNNDLYVEVPCSDMRRCGLVLSCEFVRIVPHVRHIFHVAIMIFTSVSCCDYIWNMWISSFLYPP